MNEVTLEIDKIFKGRAVLHIAPDKKYAWVAVGNDKFFFHKTSWAEPYETEYENMGGEKVAKIVIPYDGFETSL